MSPRAKFVLFAALFIVVGLLLVASLVETQGSTLIVVFFGWIAIGSYVLFSVRCNRCGTSVCYQGKVAGMPIFAGFVREALRNEPARQN